MSSLPSLFISHGAPDLLLAGDQSSRSFKELASTLPRPKAVVIISAHWINDPVGITAMENLDTIHDFGGFQSELYQILYPARGDSVLSHRIAGLLQNKGFDSELYKNRGLDHGAWVPLKLMYPEATSPVVQVSLPRGNLDQLIKFGEALKPLKEDGILIIGSGGSVHNLRELKTDGPTDTWVTEFEDWLRLTIEGNQFHQLINIKSFPDSFRRAHPTLEHYAPLIVAWAAGNLNEPGKRLHQSYSHGNLGISHYLFEEVKRGRN